jgi:hypothetical protein
MIGAIEIPIGIPAAESACMVFKPLRGRRRLRLNLPRRFIIGKRNTEIDPNPCISRCIVANMSTSRATKAL